MEYKSRLSNALKATVVGVTLCFALSCPTHLNDYRDRTDSSQTYKWNPPPGVTEDTAGVKSPR